MDHDRGSSSAFSRLPQEVADKIASYVWAHYSMSDEMIGRVPNRGAMLRICPSLYYAACPHVYRAPNLSSNNIGSFAATLWTGRTALHGHFVRSLDLRQVVHGVKTSQIARIVRRCARNLNVFRAPQVGFNQSALRAIGLCSQLRVLDAQAISAHVELSFFLAALAKLDQLEYVSFPKASQHTDGTLQIIWPPKLTTVHLSGAIDDAFLSCPLPETVTSLTLRACPEITPRGLIAMLERQGKQLTTLKTLYPLPLPNSALNKLLMLCPNLLLYDGYIEYFETVFFRNIPSYHPLNELCLRSVGGLLPDRNRLAAKHINRAMDDDKLVALESVFRDPQLRWSDDSDDVVELDTRLEYNQMDCGVDDAEGDYEG